MANRTLTTLAVATALTGATAAAQDFDVADFDALRASAGVDVAVTVGSEHSVRLVSDTDPADVRVTVSGGTLTLSRERTSGLNINFGRDARIAFEVTMPSITAAESASGADVTITGIDAGSLDLKASSGSDLTASGRCETLSAAASSGSDILAFNLSCSNVQAKSSSGSDIEIEATSSIEAAASSGGDITVRGNPEQRSIRESSGGGVTIRS
ncbi:MAG: head GIN domain-containing protein [Pseudomonadota bacterium]